jgi:tRNA-splicing ligase RtcB (3'-phosphate/5'-hydroxy nucleic acid ligase)
MSGHEIFDEGGAPIFAWTKGVQVEEAARAQLAKISRLPVIFDHVAVMPDVHLGIGATVGSVIATKGAIIPSAVGVDIGCGMIATRTSLTANDLPDNLAKIRESIERAVPHGRDNNGVAGHDKGAWSGPSGIPGPVKEAWEAGLYDRWRAVVEKHPKASAKNTVNQLGTLGTGNHFIEVCLDTEGRVWVVLHSGSRGLGNRFGEYFISLAKEDMGHLIHNLPDKDLAYLEEGTEHFKDYVEAVSMAQDFAMTNREIMMDRTLRAIKDSGQVPKFQWKLEAVNCHHNYVQKETHLGEEVFVTRKGAVRAGLGDMGIIPGSMGARSYIVRGKGNPDSFCSCSHGAGRKMSRGEAKRTFTLKDHRAATEGVECRKDEDVIDETPAAYKDIEAVMAAQADLVEVVATLKQVVCVKG